MPASSNICWKDCSARVVRDAWFDDTGRGPGRCEHPNGPFHGHGWKNLFGGGRKLRRGDETSGARYRKARNFPDPSNSIGCLVGPGIRGGDLLGGRVNVPLAFRPFRLLVEFAFPAKRTGTHGRFYRWSMRTWGIRAFTDIEEPIRAYRMASLGLERIELAEPRFAEPTAS